MSRPNTRPTNANKHPGYILRDDKPKRHTSAQKQADDAQAEEARQEREAAKSRGIKRLANIVDEAVQDEERVLTDPPRPRPRPPRKEENSNNPDADASQIAEMEGIEEDSGSSAEAAGMDESAVDGISQEEQDDDDVEIVPNKKPRSQKTSSCDSVQAARGAIQADGEKLRVSADGQKGKKQYPTSSELGKEEFTGIGEVKDWADKLDSSRPLHTMFSQHSGGSSRRAKSIASAATTGSLIKGPRATPASTRSRGSTQARPSTPADASDASALTPELHNPASYIDADDKTERAAISTSAKAVVRRRIAPLDIIEVVSGSEESETSSPPPMPLSRTQKKKAAKTKPVVAPDEAASDSDLEPMLIDEDLPEVQTTSSKGVKHLQDHIQINLGNSRSSAPPSKRAKTQSTPSGSQLSGSGANNKYINSDLPSGCLTANVWRRVYISALAHFAAGYQDPWTIHDEDFKNALQLIWDEVYKNSIKHTVVVGGPVYYVAKQNLRIWRTGFAAAAVTVITAFFAHDSDFKDAEQRTEFSAAMLKKNRFLFEQNCGLDKKTWSGMWRSPFVLQTFAHHFNFIQGCIEIPQLNGKLGGTALALAAAA
ncbi:hypothetical protein PAXINDRAFT_19912, partial [Paxillus involutus ATCC 200175]